MRGVGDLNRMRWWGGADNLFCELEGLTRGRAMGEEAQETAEWGTDVKPPSQPCLHPPPSPHCRCRRGCDRLHPAVPLPSPACQFADLTFPQNAGLSFFPHLISQGLSKSISRDLLCIQVKQLNKLNKGATVRRGQRLSDMTWSLPLTIFCLLPYFHLVFTAQLIKFAAHVLDCHCEKKKIYMRCFFLSSRLS